MSIQLIQSRDAYGGNTLAFSSSVTLGNMIVVVCLSESSMSNIAKSAGGATIGTVQTVTQRSATYGSVLIGYAFVTGAGSLTVAYTGGSDTGIAIAEFSGVNSSDAFEAENYTTTPSQNPSVTLTTTVADSLLIAALIDESGMCGTFSAGDSPGTWTLISNQPTHAHCVECIILTNTISNASCDLHTTGTPGGGYSAYQVVAFNGTAAASGNPWWYYAQQLRSLKDKWRGLLTTPSLEEVRLYGRAAHA